VVLLQLFVVVAVVVAVVVVVGVVVVDVVVLEKYEVHITIPFEPQLAQACPISDLATFSICLRWQMFLMVGRVII